MAVFNKKSSLSRGGPSSAPLFVVAAQAAAADLQQAQAFLQAFLEHAPMAMASPTLFICVASVGLREFLEGKARDLSDDAIIARLETRGNHNSKGHMI